MDDLQASRAVGLEPLPDFASFAGWAVRTVGFVRCGSGRRVAHTHL
jgi:hypothetical protein